MVELTVVVSNPPEAALELSPLADDYEAPPTFLGLARWEADRRRIAARRRFRVIRSASAGGDLIPFPQAKGKSPAAQPGD